MIYTFDKLPVHNFFIASENQDFTQLLIDGELPENINEIFEDYVNQYNEITNNKTTDSYLNDKKGLIQFRVKYIALNNILRVLYVTQSEEAISQLKQLGYTFDVNDYEASYMKLVGVLNVLEKKLGIKQTEYISKYQKEQKTKFDYVELVTIVEEHLKREIDVYSYSIKKFAYCLKKMKSWQKEK